MAAVCLLSLIILGVFMEAFLSWFRSLELDWLYLLKTGGVLLLGCVLFGLLGRFIFGKKSEVSNAVSSAIGIIFICAVTVVLRSFGMKYDSWIVPIPFVSMNGNNLVLFDFFASDYTVICSQVLSMIILAFLINLIDGWLPKNKNIFGWLFFRCLTVAVSYVLHLGITWLFTAYLPDVIVTYAPVILLALLVLMLLTGALKILVGALMATVNPVIGGLYTFFFANIIGKQIAKAVLTSAILAGFVVLLRYLGVTVISIASAALVAYIPFLLVLVILWYLVNRLL